MISIMKFLVLFVFIYNVYGSKVKDCEVCDSVLTRLAERVPSDATPEEIEIEFKEFCKTAKGKDERFCYYIGGLETSATYIIPEMSKPLSWKMPVEKICREKLLKKDSQVCDLKYEKQIDIDSIDLKTLKVKELKKILNDWGEDCKGCTEKAEFIKKIEELKPQYSGANAKKAKANSEF